MKINTKTIASATPWNVSLAKLTNLEKTIAASEGEALKARWLFGRELVSRRIDYKGRLGIPRDLMTLAMKQCGLSRSEINSRVQFALKYPTRDLMSNAVRDYPSWHRMRQQGLVEKKRGTPKKKAAPAESGRWIIRRLNKEIANAFAHHAALTREQVQDLEQLSAIINKILDQIDRNDAKRAS